MTSATRCDWIESAGRETREIQVGDREVEK